MVVGWEVGAFLMTENLSSQREEIEVVGRLSKSKRFDRAKDLLFIGGEGPSVKSVVVE